MTSIPDPTLFAERLYRSDQAYFAAATSSLHLDRATIRWMPGLAHISAGCILVPEHPEDPDISWLEGATETVRLIGAGMVRFYLLDSARGNADRFCAAGFQSAEELLMLRATRDKAVAEPLLRDLQFRAVITDQDWAAKERLAAEIPERPDGKRSTAAEWTRLERCKAEAGYCQFWMVERDGHPCATFGLARHGPLLRMKNIAVHPAHRRRKIASATIAFACRQARKANQPWLGIMALSFGPGRRLYDTNGFVEIGSVVEWSLPLRKVPPSDETRSNMAVQSC